MLFCGMAKEKRENVRVSSKTLNKVKRYIKKTKLYNIGNFYDLAAEEKLIQGREKQIIVFEDGNSPLKLSSQK